MSFPKFKFVFRDKVETPDCGDELWRIILLPLRAVLTRN
jgi:hypothetical protein